MTCHLLFKKTSRFRIIIDTIKNTHPAQAQQIGQIRDCQSILLIYTSEICAIFRTLKYENVKFKQILVMMKYKSQNKNSTFER